MPGRPACPADRAGLSGARRDTRVRARLDSQREACARGRHARCSAFLTCTVPSTWSSWSARASSPVAPALDAPCRWGPSRSSCWGSRARRGVSWSGAVRSSSSRGRSGSSRASRAVAAHEAARGGPRPRSAAPKRCTAHARVVASPVRARDSCGGTAQLDVTRVRRRAGARGTATPRSTAARTTSPAATRPTSSRTLGAPQRLWNAATGDPRPGEAHRGVVRSGGTLDVAVVRRGRGPGGVDRPRAGARTGADRRDVLRRPRADGASARARRERLGAGRRPRLPGERPVAPARRLGDAPGAGPGGRRDARSRGCSSRVEALAARDRRRAASPRPSACRWRGSYADFGGRRRLDGPRGVDGDGGAGRARARTAHRRGCARSGCRSWRWACADPLVVFDVSFLLSAGATRGCWRSRARSASGSRPCSRPIPRSSRRVAARGGHGDATTWRRRSRARRSSRASRRRVPLGGVLANLLAVPVGETGRAARLPRARAPFPVAGGRARVRRSSPRGALLARARHRARLRDAGARRGRPAARRRGSCAVRRGRARRRDPLATAGARRWPARARRAILALEIGARRAGAPHGVLRATFLDVGQGDSALVDLPDGEAMVIDGGGLVGSPDRRRHARRSRPSSARAGGATLAAVGPLAPAPGPLPGPRARGSAACASAPSGTPDRASARGSAAATRRLARPARARRRARPAARTALRWRTSWAERASRCSRPCPAFDVRPRPQRQLVRPAHHLRRARLPVRRRRRARGGGDSPRPRPATRLRADVLKVGHHGSRTSSEPGVPRGRRSRATRSSRPACATASAIPTRTTLATLAAAGVRVWRTDRDGAVTACDGRVPARAWHGRER